jgi:polysaccharide deacetylase family protein (PEP-CTERM system associated)
MSRDGRWVFTVDVEDWENATLLQCFGVVAPPTRAVEAQTLRLLDLLTAGGHTATWFFLGEVAEAFPHLVRRIVDAGHEPGIHGDHHHAVASQSPAEYRGAIRRAKRAVEEAGGAPVHGYRAVDFGIQPATFWALEVLLDEGFLYDASFFPFAGPRYGFRDAPLDPGWFATPSGRRIYEVPVSVAQWGSRRLPASGGGYFRLLPYPLTRLLLRRAERQGRQVVFYMHPCELDASPSDALLRERLSPEQYRSRRRYFAFQRLGRSRVVSRLSRLLTERRFGSIREVLNLGPQGGVLEKR